MLNLHSPEKLNVKGDYNMDKLLVSALVDEIVEETDEIREKADDMFFAGQQIAYATILSKLQRILIAESPDAPDEHGLGFDVDARVINGVNKQLMWA